MVESAETLRASRLAQTREEKMRQKRIRRLLTILLLLLLLLLALAIAYLSRFVYTPVKPGKGLVSLFSIYGLNRPLKVSTDKNGNIYVSDTGHANFLIFDANGNFQKKFGATKGPKRWYGVIGSAFDEASQRFYIADWKRRNITVLNSKGDLVKRFPENPFARIFGADGFSPFGIRLVNKKLYVTSIDGVYIFSLNGKLLKKFGSYGRKLGQFDFPLDIAVNPKNGNMYVVDQLNRRVVAMNKNGAVLWVLGRPDLNGQARSFFGLPRGIALDGEGHLFVSDTFHHEIVVLTETGKLVATLGKRGVEDAQLNFPEGITFKDANTLYIADRENNRVQVLRVELNGAPKPNKKTLGRYKKSFLKVKG